MFANFQNVEYNHYQLSCKSTWPPKFRVANQPELSLHIPQQPSNATEYNIQHSEEFLSAKLHNDITVGDGIFETLVFFNFSAQDASILKISVPISKRSSWGFRNTPNLPSLDDFEPSYCNWKKIKVFQIVLIFDFEKQCVSHFVLGCFGKLGVFRNPQELLLLMGTEILKIDAS